MDTIYIAKHLFFLSFISRLQRHLWVCNHLRCGCCCCFVEQFSFCFSFMRTGGKNTFALREETKIWRDQAFLKVKKRCAFVQFRYKIIELNKRCFVGMVTLSKAKLSKNILRIKCGRAIPQWIEHGHSIAIERVFIFCLFSLLSFRIDQLDSIWL